MNQKVVLHARRWDAFRKEKLSLFCFFILFIFCLISFSAELWSNDKPLYLKYQNKSFFPIFKRYQPSDFHASSDEVYVDYRKIALKADKVIWPLIQWTPFETNNEIERYPSEPTSQNIFGTDDRGRDVFSRLLYGFRYSMIYALLVWITCSLLAIFFGGLMGYFGGKIDLFGQRVMEVLETVPTFMILLILVSVFQPNLFLLVFISTIFGWMRLSRYVRGEFLRLRNLPFVEFAQAQGVSNLRIIFVHILPNAMTPIITFSPFMIAGNIAGLSALDYLGFGLQAPTPSWGELLSQAKANLTIAWWLAVYPSLFLFLTLVFLTLLGNGLRRAFDPKTSGN
jgi:microcin C transport system permease protein